MLLKQQHHILKFDNKVSFKFNGQIRPDDDNIVVHHRMTQELCLQNKEHEKCTSMLRQIVEINLQRQKC